MTHELTKEQDRQLEQWFSNNYENISDQAYGLFRIDRAEAALIRLASELGKCRARSEAQFCKWASRWIQKHAQRQRKNAKEFPRHEQHGDNVYIGLPDPNGQIRPWIIPASWLSIAKRLWPFHLRRYAGGSFYVAKKVRTERPDGKHGQVIVPLHRLFIDTGGERLVGDRHAHTVTANDGNYLNWAGGNLTTTQRTSRDVMDVRPHGRPIVVSLGTLINLLTLDDDILSAGTLPAKPTRPPGHGPHDSPDREEWSRSIEDAIAVTAEDGSEQEQPAIQEELPITSKTVLSADHQEDNRFIRALCRKHGLQRVVSVSAHPDGLVWDLQCGCKRSETT